MHIILFLTAACESLIVKPDGQKVMLRIKASYQNTFIHSPVSYLMPIHIIFM